MSNRNVFPPEVVNLIEELVENSEDIEDILDTIESFGDTIFGQSSGVGPNATDDVVTHEPTSQQGIIGFTGNGESDARWELIINGDTKVSQWTNQSEPNADYYFNNPIEIEPGDTVRLEVENIGLNSADYEGAIIIRI